MDRNIHKRMSARAESWSSWTMVSMPCRVKVKSSLRRRFRFLPASRPTAKMESTVGTRKKNETAIREPPYGKMKKGKKLLATLRMSDIMCCIARERRYETSIRLFPELKAYETKKDTFRLFQTE